MKNKLFNIIKIIDDNRVYSFLLTFIWATSTGYLIFVLTQYKIDVGALLLSSIITIIISFTRLVSFWYYKKDKITSLFCVGYILLIIYILVDSTLLK